MRFNPSDVAASSPNLGLTTANDNHGVRRLTHGGCDRKRSLCCEIRAACCDCSHGRQPRECPAVDKSHMRTAPMGAPSTSLRISLCDDCHRNREGEAHHISAK